LYNIPTVGDAWLGTEDGGKAKIGDREKLEAFRRLKTWQ
jgi:hypothetical protein